MNVFKGIVGLFKYSFGIGYADGQIVEMRRAICYKCPLLDKDRLKCGSCGCYIAPKTSLESEVCPEDKW